MSTETPTEQIERLEALNHKLSMQIIGMSDRLNESALQIAADAWDKGYSDCMEYHMSDGLKGSESNPYRAIIAEKEATE